jgi:hypothetical protein
MEWFTKEPRKHGKNIENLSGKQNQQQNPLISSAGFP